MASSNIPQLPDRDDIEGDVESAHNRNINMSLEKKIQKQSDHERLRSSDDEVNQTPIKNYHTSRENAQHARTYHSSVNRECGQERLNPSFEKRFDSFLKNSSESIQSRKVHSLFEMSIYNQHLHSTVETASNLFGRTIMNSKKRNLPSFTFGGRLSKNQIISSKHMNELRGKDSPGPGVYEIDALSLSTHVTKNPKFAILTEKRFEENRLREKKFKNMPHTCIPEQFPVIPKEKRKSESYVRQFDHTKTMIHNNFTGGKHLSFSKARRFDVMDAFSNPLYTLNTTSPGPAHHYDYQFRKHLFKNITKSIRDANNFKEKKIKIKDMLNRLCVH